jgi:hypothetical protein
MDRRATLILLTALSLAFGSPRRTRIQVPPPRRYRNRPAWSPALSTSSRSRRPSGAETQTVTEITFQVS